MSIDWIRHSTKRDFSEGQERCFKTLCSIASPWNLPLIGDGWWSIEDYSIDRDRNWSPGDTQDPPILPALEVHPEFILVRIRGELATYDGSELTRLVMAAHANRVRVSIRTRYYLAVDRESYVSEYRDGDWIETYDHPTSPAACLELQFNHRSRDGDRFSFHPGPLELYQMALEAS